MSEVKSTDTNREISPHVSVKNPADVSVKNHTGGDMELGPTTAAGRQKLRTPAGHLALACGVCRASSRCVQLAITVFPLARVDMR